MPLRRLEVGLLHELARRSEVRCLSVDVEQTRRELPLVGTDRVPVLLDEHDAILLIEGEDADRPGMVDEVPGHDPALTEVDVLGDDVPHVAREGPHARPHGQ